MHIRYPWCVWYRCTNVHSQSNNPMLLQSTLQHYCYSQIFGNLNRSYAKYIYRRHLFLRRYSVHKYLFSSCTMVLKSLAPKIHCSLMKRLKTVPGVSPILMQNYGWTSRSVNRERIKEGISAQKRKFHEIFGTACSRNVALSLHSDYAQTNAYIFSRSLSCF